MLYSSNKLCAESKALSLLSLSPIQESKNQAIWIVAIYYIGRTLGSLYITKPNLQPKYIDSWMMQDFVISFKQSTGYSNDPANWKAQPIKTLLLSATCNPTHNEKSVGVLREEFFYHFRSDNAQWFIRTRAKISTQITPKSRHSSQTIKHKNKPTQRLIEY